MLKARYVLNEEAADFTDLASGFHLRFAPGKGIQRIDFQPAHIGVQNAARKRTGQQVVDIKAAFGDSFCRQFFLFFLTDLGIPLLVDVHHLIYQAAGLKDSVFIAHFPGTAQDTATDP